MILEQTEEMIKLDRGVSFMSGHLLMTVDLGSGKDV